MKTFLIIFLLSIFSLFATDVHAQTNSEPLSDELHEMLKSDPFNVGLLLQSTANYSFKEDDFNDGRSFGLGVARLRLGGELDGNFSYVLQMEFLRGVSAIDLALGYEKSEQFKIVVGAQKPDIGLDLQPNPGNTDFINRARLIGTMINSREVGVSAQGTLNVFDYNVAVFNGQGLDIENDGNFMYLAKLGYTVELDANGSVYAAVNGALNTTEDHAVGNSGFSATDRLIYGAYAKFDSDVWFGALEFLQTSFDDQEPTNERITGFYTTIGNKVTDRSEILGRWDHISYNNEDFNSNRFVLGWNYQATTLISFQVNALAEFDDIDERFGISGNFQFQF